MNLRSTKLAWAVSAVMGALLCYFGVAWYGDAAAYEDLRAVMHDQQQEIAMLRRIVILTASRWKKSDFPTLLKKGLAGEPVALEPIIQDSNGGIIVNDLELNFQGDRLSKVSSSLDKIVLTPAEQK